VHTTRHAKFFGIVRRGAATIMFKALDVEPFPNYSHGRWWSPGLRDRGPRWLRVVFRLCSQV